MKKYTLNESEAKMIADASPRKIAESGVLNDLSLSKSDRIQRAAKILKNRQIK